MLSSDKTDKRSMTRIRQLFNRACTQYHLLSDGDRILLALSGGKDSLVMTRLMAERARIFRPSIQVEAAHVVMENVPYEADLKYMQEFCQDLGLRLNILHTSFNEATDTRKTHCFLCARYRRRTLMEYAQDHGFNKVSLGHHMDDFLATMLMNMLYEGSFHSMSPAMSMLHYPLTLIRPLCLVQEKDIAATASAHNMVRQILPCPYEDKTRRSAMESLARTLCSIHDEARQNMWHALEKSFNPR